MANAAGARTCALRPTECYGLVAGARIGQHVLARRIPVVAVALRQIITGLRSGCRAGDGAGRSAGNGTDSGAAGATRQKTAEQPSYNGAANGACGRIRRRWWWRRRVGTGRRRISSDGGRAIGTADVVDEILGDVGRRTLHLFRIVIPGTAATPPPAGAAIVDFVMPASALPGDTAAIGLSAVIARRQSAAREASILWPSASPLPGTSGPGFLRLNRGLGRGFLSGVCGRLSGLCGRWRIFGMRRQREPGQRRDQRKDEFRPDGRAHSRIPPD